MNAEDFITVEVDDGIATLWIDHRRESQNVVSPDVIAILETVFVEIEHDPAIRAIVLISRKPNFIAGADIASFAIEKEGAFRPMQERGHRALERLEGGSKPVVAAIHGACMGLGTELALACHARIASTDPSTRLALPEVKLGLLPGGGGTQRLPRRVGIQRALDMMLTGKNIYAHQARKMGLVDDLVAPQKLHHAAVVMVRRLLSHPMRRSRRRTLLDRVLEDNPLGRRILFRQARKRAYRQSRGNYPAVPAILDCVETGYRDGIAAGYLEELERFERLMLTPQSAAMRALFFAMTDNKKNPWQADARQVDTIGVVGAGFMGAGIAEVSVLNGMQVLLKDIDEEVIAQAQRGIWKELQKKVRYRALTKTEAEETIGRLRPRLEYKGFAHAQLVVEAVVEKMALKQSILAELERAGGDAMIIATNTSSLSVTEMAEAASRPERVIGMHYFSPVPRMPLLEIVRTPHTADWVLAIAYDTGVKQGKTCIVVEDRPGFYVNRILAPYMNEALLLLDEGVGIEAIDRAMKDKGFPVGPIQLFDQVGLDIAAHVVHSSEALFGDRDGFEVSHAVVRMFEAGRLGKKNGKGFYRYDARTGKRLGYDATAYAFFEGDGLATVDAALLQDRMLLLMVNEAVLCLEEGVIRRPVDGDLGAVFGIGFLPFEGGPFRYCDRLGARAVVGRLEELAEVYGPKFTPAPRLHQMAKSGERFYAG